MPDDHLKNGKLLDGRYRIIRTIGEGGFGITYEAVNIHNSLHVAVKECKSEADKDRFLREARVLRDFSDDPAIVTVLDSFEDNNTAYIVMEYLDGITLAKEIKRSGRWPSETAVRSFVPVMKALEKMHAAGVIHRDISPDNLMLMPDGSLILLDFGAVLPEKQSEFSQTAIFKSIYSPPEQRDSTLETGSWSDVYALCSTIWFCITGTEPEDTLSRLLFDELQLPSDLGADIVPQAEQVLMKGLALHKEDRTQDIYSLRTELEKVYPDLTEEEKKEIAKRLKRHRRILAICVCAAAAAAAVLLYTYRFQILFPFIETETIAFSGKEMNAEEYAASAPAVKERVRTLSAGGRFLLRENDQEIYFEMPAADLPDFGDTALLDVIRSSVSRPMVLSVYDLSEPDYSKAGRGVFSQTEDIADFLYTGDGAVITFSDEASQRLGDLLKTKDTALLFLFDDSAIIRKHLSYEGVTTGDGCSVRVTNNGKLINLDENGRTFWGEYSVPPELFELHFTKAPSEQFFSVNTGWIVRWENPEDTMFPGQNQQRAEKIPGTTVCVRYPRDFYEEEYEGYDPSLMSFQGVMKNRLDSLGIPYAVGLDRFSDDCFVVKVPAGSVWMEELKNLGTTPSIWLGSSLTYKTHSFDIDREMKDDGTFDFIAAFSGYDTENAVSLVRTASNTGDGQVYLYYDNRAIASCDPDTALASLENEGVIRFNHWTIEDHTAMDETTVHFADWLIVSESASPQKDRSMQTLDFSDDPFVEVRDENGTPVYFDYEDLLPEQVLYDSKTREINDLVRKWANDYAEQIEFRHYSSGRSLSLYADVSDLSDPAASLSAVKKWAAQCKEVIRDGAFDRISVALYSERNHVSITYGMSFEEGCLTMDRVSAGANDLSGFLSEANSDLFVTSYKEYLKKNPLFD